MREVLTRRRVLVALAVLLLLVVLVFAWQAYTAATSLFAARSKADTVEKLLRSGDFDGASRELAAMQAKTRKARKATDGPIWDLGRHLPWFGRNIGAVQTAAEVLDHVTVENAPIGLRLSRAVTRGELKPHAGRVNLAAVRSLTPDVRHAAESITRDQARLDAIDLDALTFPFEQVVRQLDEQVDRAGSAARSTDTAFTLLPQMLGAQHPRKYLLLIQNNAEARATGGIPGSIAILRADKGHVTMGFQGAAHDVEAHPVPVDTVPREVRWLYGDTVDTDFRDIDLDPHFPDVARTAAAMFKHGHGVDVDGVVSVDPVTLGLMLEGTGPVNVVSQGRTTELNFASVVSTLLNTAYQVLPDQSSQDDFFQKSARAIFDAVLGGAGNERLTITGMATGAAQHRVLVWSKHPEEEQRLSGTAVAGEITGGGKHPRVGIYLNDATAGKPEFYLDTLGALSSRGCTEGSQALEASVALTSKMPADFGKLSIWITGTGQYVPRGVIGVNVHLYGPTGGRIDTLSVDGRSLAVTADRQRGRQVATVPLRLEPGQRVVITARMTTARDQTAEPVLDMTPGIDPQPNGVQVTSSCPE